METKLGTRAVARQIEPGVRAVCPCCEQPVKFIAKQKSEARRQVIVNIYEGDRWDRVEHWHAQCYADAGNPHGEPRGKK